MGSNARLSGHSKKAGRDIVAPADPIWHSADETVPKQLDPSRVVFAHDHAVWEP